MNSGLLSLSIAALTNLRIGYKSSPLLNACLFFLPRVRRRKTLIIRVFSYNNRRNEGKKQKEKKRKEKSL
jgi:hypothetical protein